MKFTVPPEIFTSTTDLFDAIAAAAFLIVLRREKGVVARLWRVVMISLVAGGIMGFTVHLLEWDKAVENVIWVILPLPMCIACSMFSAVAAADVFPQKIKPTLIFFSVLCAFSYAGLVALFLAGKKFLVIYTFYAVICVLFSAAMFGYSFVKTGRKSYLLYLLGILVEVPGGIVQAKRDLYFTFIWKMDFNTVYHLILLATIILFTAGYLCSRKEKSAESR